MGINLENELEPLLARLTPYFDDLVARCYQGDEDKLRIAANEAWQALLHLSGRFRSYYTLDNSDLDGLPAQLFDPTWDVPPPARTGVPQANWYGAVGGASLYSKIVSADY